MSTALLTDRYELTMLEAALRSGHADRRCGFEVFARRLPGGRRFGVLAGTGRLLELIEGFRFGAAELAWLRESGVVGAETLDWLAGYRFSGDIRGYREGEVYFPGSPVLEVEATFAEGVLLETLVLSVLNYDSAVATAAARMVAMADDRPIAEMGSRRVGEHSAVAAARAAYIAGFTATSNLEAGRTWGVPTMGTAAHAFTLLYDGEAEAFEAQLAVSGPDTTLLVDTYDLHTGVRRAVEAAGTSLGAVRIDSGDLPVVVGQVRRQLDALGAEQTRITVTGDLDEYALSTLRTTPADAYGVGTSVVTGSGSPAAGMVYKLVARTGDDGQWHSVAKRSIGKPSVGGRKDAFRRLVDGVAVEESVTIERELGSGSSEEGRMLQVPLVSGGAVERQWLGASGVAAARAHHALAIAELPDDAFRLSPGDPAIPTVTS